MAAEELKGFYINQRVISFVLGIISLMSVVVGGVTVVNGYTNKIEQLEKRNVELVSEMNRLSDKIEELNKRLVDLTISITKLEERVRK
jgi:wobble nucleotide-excising tRNase